MDACAQSVVQQPDLLIHVMVHYLPLTNNIQYQPEMISHAHLYKGVEMEP